MAERSWPLAFGAIGVGFALFLYAFVHAHPILALVGGAGLASLGLLGRDDRTDTEE